MGTANNISRTLGIADLPVTQLIRSCKTAHQVAFDAGVATRPWGVDENTKKAKRKRPAKTTRGHARMRPAKK